MGLNTDILIADLSIYVGAGDAAKIVARIKENPVAAWLNGDIGNLLKYLAYHIDKIGADLEDLQDDQVKRDLVAWLDDLFEFDGWMEHVDGWVFERIVDYGVDWAITELKEAQNETIDSTAGAGPTVVDPDNGSGSGAAG